MQARHLMLIAMAAAAIAADATTFTLDPTADVRIMSYSPTANQNGNFLSTYTASGNVQHTMIQFDYSGIAGMSVVSATLRLYGQAFFFATDPTSIDFYRVASPWTEDETTWRISQTGTNWMNEGGDALGTGGGQMTDPYTHWDGNNTNTAQWFEFDVTSLVAGAVNGDFDNNGMMLVGASGNQLSWVSREGHTFNSIDPTGKTPQLVVNAESVPEPASFVAVAGLLALARRRRATR